MSKPLVLHEGGGLLRQVVWNPKIPRVKEFFGLVPGILFLEIGD
jgi:hypothetical protein